ncbi:MAG: M3 family metallopeptidase [Bacteroidales bacterium]|jgi:peptidyl-dipeptidase Dcp|nr:M3 family metallopeptidase [Bacteroidales bacterium]
MRQILVLLTVSTMFFLNSCKLVKKPENPFFGVYQTPFQVPPFDKIDTSCYMPAFLEAIKKHNTEIEAIVQNTRTPDFENTILAFDQSGKLLTRVSKVFYNLNETNTDAHMQSIARRLSPLMSKHNDDISLNEKLFSRIKAVYEKRKEMNLDSQQLRVVEKYYRDFERQGANLSPDQKEKLRKLNAELSLLSLTFGENLLAETNENFSLVIENKKDLDGLPQSVIDGAAETAKEKKLKDKWVFGLSKPSMIPFLQYDGNRALREKIYRGYFMRGDNGNKNDNNSTVHRIVKLRVEKAKLLGFKNYAAYIIDDNMAKTPENVDAFLMKLWNSALPVAKKEVIEMQKIIDREGGKFKLQPWDWWYYAEIVRKEKFDLNENELKPYFSLSNVRDGMFMVANKLYGISFTKRTDLPLYHPDVETYEVKEANGDHLGILYLDYYPRDSKRGGAWCTDFRSAGWENGKRIAPVMSLVCNFTKPTTDMPSLLSWDETTTLFHEFGHALHGLFTEGKYIRTAGVVPQDYVELPSQINENWAGEPAVLKAYAKNYKTGEPIPDKLVEKILKSGLFNQGFETVEYLAASLLDLDYHEMTEPEDINPEIFEKNAMDKIGLIPEILPRYRSTYFAHIFDGGYAAGYYVYIWAAVLDADAFNAFKESGDIYNKELASKFRKYCLAESGNDEGMVQYKKFRGQEPSVEPLLKHRGLK